MSRKKTESFTESVTFIEDPFGINTLEIAEAQERSEEDFEINDENLEEDLEGIAAAISEQNERHQAELESLLPSPEEQAAENESRLAAEIAEDNALAATADQQDETSEEDPELQAALPKLPVEAEDGSLDLSEMESCLEALLFIADRPLSIQKLREYLGPDFKLSLFEEAMASLQQRFQATHHGIELVEVGGGFQLRTKTGRAALARKLAKVQVQRLSTGAMETLAITAYRQPVMKEDIDKIRGVDSSHFIRGLLDKKLIRISGRSELPGRPMLYSTTQEFLELFGLKDLSSLPSLRELEQMIPASSAQSAEEEDPRVKEMRRLVGQMKADNSTLLNYDPKEDEQILKQIRERVHQIPTSTPYLDEQKTLEKQRLEQEAGALTSPESPPAT